ncbi:hypothetical protein [Actinomadura decatromicini]|uniref:Uncharacterized protein n=1 Tax=Actinomadura decatromicini TaxID=2604572 RepID=A0A5D3FVA6_9ACTN|nr:hypothetical protein [Actinomadura decatromicini]TYK52787.1 hypothetical protein FXF68_03275 [Actinomadura decatromicini]
MGADVALVRAWDDPAGPRARRGSGAEGVLIDAAGTAPLFVHLRRSPVRDAARLDGTAADEHLVAGPGVTSWAWLSCADVIVRRPGGGGPGDFPGCLVLAVASPRGCLLAVRGWRARLVPVAGGGACGDDDVARCASALHLWVCSGRPPAALAGARLTVVRGQAPEEAGGVPASRRLTASVCGEPSLA